MMKSVRKRPEERVRAFEPSSGSEKCFRYPALEEISEISCCIDPQKLIENDQPDDVAGPDARIS
jgi:hypothetical protein